MEDIYYYKYIKYKKKYMALSKLHKGGMSIVASNLIKVGATFAKNNGKKIVEQVIKKGTEEAESIIKSKIPEVCEAVSTKLSTDDAQINPTSICKIVGDTIKSKIPSIGSDTIMKHFNNECIKIIKPEHMPKTANKDDITKYCNKTITTLITKSFDSVKKSIK